ncbi:hypothetical protein C8Q80DRAFT_484576 [Daedaleopsis nitida]|nr:hypothetical protein C8Q80DRAFT_484576 [Daedaleopsis nitida]
MPAERTKTTSLRQTTLFSSGFSDSKPIQSILRAHSPQPLSTSTRATRAKPKRKAKAGDEDRVLTDAILSIKPEFTQLIAKRKKNHEYRGYKLKESISRFWLYETAPTSAITYVMITTTPKVPGEVNDPSGVGNDDFDKGLKKSKYGYPVTELYKLKKPLPTSELKTRFDIAVPQGWRYATRKLVEEMQLEDMDKLW